MTGRPEVVASLEAELARKPERAAEIKKALAYERGLLGEPEVEAAGGPVPDPPVETPRGRGRPKGR